MNPTNQSNPTRSPASRIVAAAVLAASGLVLGLASWLDASPEGVGTHRQLGLPACGFYSSVGLPCASCGMTTAFSHAAHGRLIKAFYTQPAGACLAVLLAAAGIVAAYALVTGMRLGPAAAWMLRPTSVVAAAAGVLMAWGYKMAIVQAGM